MKYLFDPEKVTTLDRQFHRVRGMFPQEVSFQTALETVDLHLGGEPLLSAVRFLVQHFSERADGGYRDLAMFTELGWRTDHLLVETNWSATNADELRLDGSERSRTMCVLACVVRSVARQHVSLSPAQAEQRGRALVRRSVFPFAQILSHWPSQRGVQNYFIFPIWESLIGNDYRPSIFAHVFSARRTVPNMKLADAIREEADFLNAQLLPFGRLIAQSTYDQLLRRSQIEGRLASAAYSIGHPMKRRVDSVHAILNSMLDLKPDVETTLKIHAAGRAALRVGRLGHVLDALSDLLRSDKERQVFQDKADWRRDQPLYLGGIIEVLNGSCLAPGVRPVKARVAASVNGARIGCWLKDDQGRLYRPADLFYEELVFELFLNAAKHGAGSRDGVEVEVSCQTAESHDGPVLTIGFVNRVDSSKAGIPGNWAIWNEHGDAPVGGLYFLTSLLVRGKLGRLWIRTEWRKPHHYFAVALELNGLEQVK